MPNDELFSEVDAKSAFWRAGAWLFKTEVNEHVPPLHSRNLKRKKEAPVPG